MGNGGWHVTKVRACCAVTPFLLQPPPPRLQGRKQGCSRGARLSGCSPAAVEGFAKPAGPAVKCKGRVHHRRRKLPGGGRGTRGLGGWKGRPPPRSAFSRNKKPKEAPNNPAWWGSKRAGTPPLDARRFPPAGMQNPLLCLLPTAFPVPAGCLGSDAGCWRRAPPHPHARHTTPEVLRELLYLLSLWEYLFLLIGMRTFHLGHGNKGGQVRSGAS